MRPRWKQSPSTPVAGRSDKYLWAQLRVDVTALSNWERKAVTRAERAYLQSSVMAAIAELERRSLGTQLSLLEPEVRSPE
jgi:hypothetical protein